MGMKTPTYYFQDEHGIARYRQGLLSHNLKRKYYHLFLIQLGDFGRVGHFGPFGDWSHSRSKGVHGTMEGHGTSGLNEYWT